MYFPLFCPRSLLLFYTFQRRMPNVGEVHYSQPDGPVNNGVNY